MSGFPIVSDADFSDQRNVEFGHRVHDLRKVFSRFQYQNDKAEALSPHQI